MNDLRLSTLEKYKEILSYRNYSENTIKVYLSYATKFLFEVDCPQSQLTGKKIKDYLINYKYSSIYQQNQVVSSIKLYTKYILKLKGLDKIFLERPRKEKSLPKVIDKELMIDRLSKIKNLKHKTILSLAFSTGMRSSEVINLKIADIDSNRMLILIRNSKFNKDRYVPLSEYILDLLRKYYKAYKPKEFLFNGQNHIKYSRSSLSILANEYLKCNFHRIRHSALTSMLENGTDFRVLQKVAGHSSSKTTEIYTHVSTKILSNVKTAI